MAYEASNHRGAGRGDRRGFENRPRRDFDNQGRREFRDRNDNRSSDRGKGEPSARSFTGRNERRNFESGRDERRFDRRDDRRRTDFSRRDGDSNVRRWDNGHRRDSYSEQRGDHRERMSARRAAQGDFAPRGDDRFGGRDYRAGRNNIRRNDRGGRRDDFARNGRDRFDGDRQPRERFTSDDNRRNRWDDSRPQRSFSRDSRGYRDTRDGRETRDNRRRFGHDQPDTRGDFRREGRRDDWRGGRRGFERNDRGSFDHRGHSRDTGDYRGERRFDRDRGRFDRDDRFSTDSRGRDVRDEFDAHFDDTQTIDGLVIPDGVEPTELDAAAYEALASLGGRNQNTVAKLLVMAGQLVDLDPERAYAYAQAATKRAGRLDVVREAAAITAYAAGHYTEALREVRAVRRMRGDLSLRAVEADCERGLGRPEKALEIVDSTAMEDLPLDEQVEMVLVAAGARADLEEFDAALLLIDDAIVAVAGRDDDELTWRLMSAKVDHLRALGRDEEADAVEQEMPEEPEDNDIVDVQMFADVDIDNLRSDLKGSDEPPIQRYDTLVLDLDGVCYMGSQPVEHAAEGVNAAVDAGMNQVYVTNNSSRTPAAVAEQLSALGLPADESCVMTSAMDATALMREHCDEGARVFVIGGEGLRQAVRDAGFEVVDSADDKPAAVVQGFDRSVDWAMLSEGAFAISAGAQFFSTNMDATLPVERGFALGNGALVRAVRHATSVKPIAAGKPMPGIFRRAIEMVGGEHAIAVGDRLETDIAGALSASVPSMHVLTGVHDARAVMLAPRGQRPQLVHRDMRGLCETHPRPRHHKDGTWTCGVSQVAKVTRGHLTLDGVELHDGMSVTLDSYRALIAAAWETIDRERGVECPKLTVVDNDDPTGIVETPEVEPVSDTEPMSESEASLDADRADAELDVDDTEVDGEGLGSIEFDDIDLDDDDLSGVDVDAVPEFLPGEEDLEQLLDETADLDSVEDEE